MVKLLRNFMIDKTCPEGSLYEDTSRTVLWLSQGYGVLLRLT